MTQAIESEADWTAGDTPNVASPLFLDLAAVVERLIRDSATDLLAGRADKVAHRVLGELAREHGLAPSGAKTPRPTLARRLRSYSDWANRTPEHQLQLNDWVSLTPPELGGGTVLGYIDCRGGDGSWGVVVPYDGDGALVYVHQADVKPAPPPAGWTPP